MASTSSINGIWRPPALHKWQMASTPSQNRQMASAPSRNWQVASTNGKWRPQMANGVRNKRRQMASATSINGKWRPQRLSKNGISSSLSENGISRLCTIARAPPCSAARSVAPSPQRQRWMRPWWWWCCCCCCCRRRRRRRSRRFAWACSTVLCTR